MYLYKKHMNGGERVYNGQRKRDMDGGIEILNSPDFKKWVQKKEYNFMQQNNKDKWNARTVDQLFLVVSLIDLESLYISS